MMEDLKADGMPWDDSMKVVKAIESHILAALKLADDHPGLNLSEPINGALENVIACRETMEMSDKDFGEEQTAELKKELGTEGTSVNEPDTKDTSMSEQERLLREAILGGMQDGPGGN